MGVIYQSNIVVLIMSMTDLEYFLNKELLLPLKVPLSWFISKNYLYDVNCNWLNQLNEDDKFKMSEIYLYKIFFMLSWKGRLIIQFIILLLMFQFIRRWKMMNTRNLNMKLG